VPTADRARIRWVFVALAFIALLGFAVIALPRVDRDAQPGESQGVHTSLKPPESTVATGSIVSAEPEPSSARSGVPFLTRPGSGPLYLEGCRDVVIENLTFQGLGPDVEAIHLEDCDGVRIRDNDFARVAQAITILDSTNVHIEGNRYEDILGPSARVGLHRGNFIQLDNVRGAYIGHNKGRGGDTEDIISIHASGGTATAPLVVEMNHFEGTNWSSGSGSGIALGDHGSHDTIARDNILLNPGQVGIFIAGGTNNAIVDNVIYGEQRALSNVGIYVWNQADGECSGNEVRGNKVRWYREDGEDNARWDQGNCGTVAGWSTNDWEADLDPETLRVDLSTP
jgi:nitrous oxidase accessory protein NosD